MDNDSKMILARRSKELLGEEVSYVLFAEVSPDAKFRMTVEFRGESETCRLGSSVETALDTFLLVFSGGVTPCTLKDVIEDLSSK